MKDGHGDLATALQLAMLHPQIWGYTMWDARVVDREEAL